MSTVQNYIFTDEDPVSNGIGRTRHRRGNSKTSTGSDQSLTYSASSSVSQVSTGESTDSSFAEIYRVIDDEKISSLIGDEHMKVPKTITGQPSDSHGNDGGGLAVFEQANPDDTRYRGPSRSTSKSRDKSKSRDSKNDEKIKHSKTNQNKTPPPPRIPIQKNDGKELWYSQLWMCGFADSLRFSRD